MANHVIPEDPKYNSELRKLETTDKAHADVFNSLFEQLIQNDASLHKAQEGDAGSIGVLQEQLETKADASRVEALEKTVETKADADALSDLEQTVGTKANQTDLEALGEKVDTKADQSELAKHTGDKTVHITADERTAWNAKADETSLTAHTKDTTVHITDAERTKWNAKADASALSAHTADKTVHITAEERTAWNAKADKTALDTHTKDTTIHVTSAEKSTWSGKADAKALSDHTGNATIHVTADNKTAWNAKADASALTKHTGDTTVHVTAAERTAWNAKANGTHSHKASEITDGGSTWAAKTHTHEEYVKKAGDTVTGALTTKGGTNVWVANASGGTAGNLQIAEFKFTVTYPNSPIILTVTRRGKTAEHVEILFSNDNDTAPSLVSFYYSGDNFLRIKEVSTGVWRLYGIKADAWESMCVTEFQLSEYMQAHVAWTWTNVFLATLPDGCVAPTLFPTFAAATHKHNAASELTGVLPAANGGTGNANGQIAWGNVTGKPAIPAKPTVTTVTLATTWTSNAQAVTVSGITATETDQLIIPVPAIASQQAYMDSGIRVTKQEADKLTFTCDAAPATTLTVYVVVFSLK